MSLRLEKHWRKLTRADEQASDAGPSGAAHELDGECSSGAVPNGDGRPNGDSGGSDAGAVGLPASGLLTLPPELLDVVLAHVPPAELLSTVRALRLVLPYAVSRRWAWEHLVLASPRHFYPLYRALARERDRRAGRVGGQKGGDELVRTLAVECWRGDVDMLNK